MFILPLPDHGPTPVRSMIREGEYGLRQGLPHRLLSPLSRGLGDQVPLRRPAWRDPQRVREIIRQVCAELGVTIVEGVLSQDHVHMFVSVPPQLSVSELMRRVKGRSSRKIQQEFPVLRKRYWGRHFWARGYFSTTSGNITDDVILQYLANHIDKPTGVSR